MPGYLCKFIPPRADFLSTMTPDEKIWMGQHGAYLDEMTSRGLVVAHGPVIDPTGSYGVSLWQIDAGQDIAALTGEDPIIRNGVGHYDHFPMIHLRSRDQAAVS